MIGFGARILALGLAGALGLVSCSKSEETKSDAPIVLGTLVAIRGDLSGTGVDNQDAENLAVEQINAAGGVLGRPLFLKVEDDATTVEGALAGYQRLLESKPPVVIGPSSSSQVVSIVDLARSTQTTTFGRTSTSTVISTVPDDGFLFRVAPSDAYQGKLLAELVTEAKPTKICLVHRDDTYGSRLAEVFTAALPKGAGAPPITDVPYNPRLDDLSFVMPKCDALRCSLGAGDAGAPSCSPESDRVALVMFSFVADAAAILRSAKGWAAQNQPIFFSDGARDQELIDLGLPPTLLYGARGTIPSGPPVDTEAGAPRKRFQEAFEKRYGRPAPAFSENGYEAVYVAASAIELAGTATPGPAIRDAVARVNDPNGAPASAGDWAAMRAALHGPTGMAYRGVTGRCEFDPNGDLRPPIYYRVWRMDSPGSGAKPVVVASIKEVTQ